MNVQDQSPSEVTLQSGIVLNHLRDGSGTTLIFVHGAMGDFRSWSPQWQLFTQYFACITYSRRYSYPNPNRMETRQHSALVDAEDLLGLMDVLSISSTILVGSSYGGFTALALAVLAPERVKAIVSVEAPMMRYAEISDEGAAIARAFRETTVLPAREAFERGDDLEGVQRLTGGIVGRNPNDIPSDVIKRRMQNVQAARSLSLSDDEFPLLDPTALSALPMPVLLMSGAETAPIHAAIFAGVSKAMPKARTCIVKGSGHSVSQQQPEVFNAEVLGFLSDNGLLPQQSSD